MWMSKCPGRGRDTPVWATVVCNQACLCGALPHKVVLTHLLLLGYCILSATWGVCKMWHRCLVFTPGFSILQELQSPSFLLILPECVSTSSSAPSGRSQFFLSLTQVVDVESDCSVSGDTVTSSKFLHTAKSVTREEVRLQWMKLIA